MYIFQGDRIAVEVKESYANFGKTNQISHPLPSISGRIWHMNLIYFKCDVQMDYILNLKNQNPICGIKKGSFFATFASGKCSWILNHEHISVANLSALTSESKDVAFLRLLLPINCYDCGKIWVLLPINRHSFVFISNFATDESPWILNHEHILVANLSAQTWEKEFSFLRLLLTVNGQDCKKQMRLFPPVNDQDCRKMRFLLPTNRQDCDQLLAYTFLWIEEKCLRRNPVKNRVFVTLYLDLPVAKNRGYGPMNWCQILLLIIRITEFFAPKPRKFCYPWIEVKRDTKSEFSYRIFTTNTDQTHHIKINFFLQQNRLNFATRKSQFLFPFSRFTGIKNRVFITLYIDANNLPVTISSCAIRLSRLQQQSSRPKRYAFWYVSLLRPPPPKSRRRGGRHFFPNFQKSRDWSKCSSWPTYENILDRYRVKLKSTFKREVAAADIFVPEKIMWLFYQRIWRSTFITMRVSGIRMQLFWEVELTRLEAP